MQFPYSIQNLINYFSKLPTVGPKTAERYVFYLLKQNSENLQEFAQAIAELKEKISTCKHCLVLAETNPCEICSNSKRNHSTLCVVADTKDLISIEKTKTYNGIYHVLGGLLDSAHKIKPENLSINILLKRIKSNDIKEIIIALNPNFEGETTTMYLVRLLKPFNLKITRLAKGLPIGADLEYADEITLSNALKYRNEL